MPRATSPSARRAVHAQHVYELPLLTCVALYPSTPWLLHIAGQFTPVRHAGGDMLREYMHFVNPMTQPPWPLNPISCGWSQWFPGECFDRAGWTCFAVEYVIEGNGELIVEGQRHELRQGDVFILHPKEHHLYRAGPQGIFRKHFIVFHGGHTNVMFKMLGLHTVSHVRPSTSTAPQVKRLYAEIEAVAQRQPEDFIRRISTLSYELLNVLMATVRRHQPPPVLPAPIVRAVRFADAHLTEVLSVVQLAKVARCTPRHLCRLFQQHLHIGVHEWLARNKIIIAAIDLRLSTKKVWQVAEDAGFENRFYFMAMFKRLTGLTPTVYRQRCSSMKEQPKRSESDLP